MFSGILPFYHLKQIPSPLFVYSLNKGVYFWKHFEAMMSNGSGLLLCRHLYAVNEQRMATDGFRLNEVFTQPRPENKPADLSQPL